MNNLRKFATEAEYSAATLNYPAVSWIVSGDTLHYDLSGDTPTPSAPAIKVAFTMDECGNGKTMAICDTGEAVDGLSAITVNGEDVDISSSEIYIDVSANTEYLIEYFLKDDTTHGSYMFSNLHTPWGCASATIMYDVLFPEQITSVSSLDANDNVNNVILLSPTVVTVGDLTSSHMPVKVYVPDNMVNSYKSAWESYLVDDYVYPLSEYEGNIPV